MSWNRQYSFHACAPRQWPATCPRVTTFLPVRERDWPSGVSSASFGSSRLARRCTRRSVSASPADAPALARLLGGYLHHDGCAEAGSVEGAVAMCVRGEPRDPIGRHTAEAWSLAMSDVPAREQRDLPTAAGCACDPSADGGSARR